MKNKILVTGGLGYIGSHTCVELINSGYEVIIIDDLSNSSVSVLDRIEEITTVRPDFYELNILDLNALKEIFKKEKFHSVVHFAAYKAVGESVSEPLKYYRNNLLSTINLLECIEESNLDTNFVFSSSATVYGNPDKCPINEKMKVQQPTNPYGNTKKVGEEIISDFCKVNKKIKGISLRYFNPIGAHESGLIGENPQGIPNNLMPYITQTAKGLRSQLTVFGDDYPTKDGTGVRDYIHVVDLAKAHVAALNYLLQLQNSDDNYLHINIGTGNGYSVLEMIKAFEQENNIKVNYQIGERRAGDIATCYADPTLAKELLGWEAKYGVNEMVKTAWEFEKRNS